MPAEAPSGKGLAAKKLPLELTGMETVFLIDAIKNTDIAEGLPDPDARVPIARNLLLVLGSVYTELVVPPSPPANTGGVLDGPCRVLVTEDEAWLLRSKVKTGDLGMDKKDVGTGLLIKLYALLLDFNGIDDLDFVDIPDRKMSDEDKTRLAQFNKDSEYLDRNGVYEND